MSPTNTNCPFANVAGGRAPALGLSDHNRDSVLELLPYRTLMEKVYSVLSARKIIVTCILKLIYKI